MQLCVAQPDPRVATVCLPPEVRKVIYTTNPIGESMNARLRKVTRNRGQFPSGQAALKVLYLAVRNLEEFRGAVATWESAAPAVTIKVEIDGPSLA
jgi:transposase-like protein